ncbi:MAG TPA: proline/glycine betaine ABC transporter permease [Symbiobacteriaceae bacterium]|nr:proline/glycine betaine ABC transporter permease [Symbiobacteriaceae bacterium]
MNEFPKMIQIPLDKWIDRFVDWLTVAAGPFLDSVSTILLAPLVRLERFLLWLPWFLVIVAVALVAWRVVGWRLAAGSVAGLMFIGMMGLWTHAMKTLTLVIAGTVLAIIVAIPVGIAMSRSDRLERIMRPVLDMMQTMPSFVYLVPALMFFGMGKVPAVLSTFIYAVPPAIRLTNLGIRQVSPDVIEAARAFGSSPRQLLLKVQLPLAMPTIMAGVNQTVMMALAMVVVASMVGAGGLGTEVLNGIARLETGRGFNGGISIVIMAIIIDRLTQSFTKTRPGMEA